MKSPALAPKTSRGPSYNRTALQRPRSAVPLGRSGAREGPGGGVGGAAPTTAATAAAGAGEARPPRPASASASSRRGRGKHSSGSGDRLSFDPKKPFKCYSDGLKFKQMGEKWYQLGNKQMAHRATFHQMDTDRNGLLNWEEFKMGFDYKKFGLTMDELEKVWQVFDRDGSGEVDHNEFLGFLDGFEPLNPRAQQGFWPWVDGARDVVPVVPPKDPDSVWGVPKQGSFEEDHMTEILSGVLREKFMQHDSLIRLCFRRMDADRNGQIEQGEFVSAMKKLEFGLSTRQLELIFQAADSDGSGSLDYEEFLDKFECDMPLDGKKGVQTSHEVIARGKAAGAEGARAAALSNPGIRMLQEKIPRYRARLMSNLKSRDAHRNGCVRFDHLKNALRGLQNTLTDAEVEQAVESFCPGARDGVVFYRDFIRFLLDEDGVFSGSTHRRMGSMPVPREPAPEDTQARRLAAAISERQKLNVHRCASAPTGASRSQRFANTPYKSTFRLTQCDEGGPAHMSEGQRFRTTHKTTFNHIRRAGHPHRSPDRP